MHCVLRFCHCVDLSFSCSIVFNNFPRHVSFLCRSLPSVEVGEPSEGLTLKNPHERTHVCVLNSTRLQ